jgi:TonB-dependent starch-binding outer membrane protein SusC
MTSNFKVHKHRLPFIIMLVLWMPVISLAQIRVSGNITYMTDNQPVAGVNVTVKGTTNGTISDLNGNFSITVDSQDDVLVFSMVGMLTEEVKVGTQTTIDVNMSEDLISLDELVVIGYGTVRKGDITGAVTSVDPEDIEATKVSNAVQALQGKAAGVDIRRKNGRAGGGYNVIIRGKASLSGDTDPLYIVDGAYYYGDIDIDPNDIESIDILKDGSTTAIYGPRGANGVVIITTKKGTPNKPLVTFNTFAGITSPLGRIPVMNRQEYLDYLTDINWISTWENPESEFYRTYSRDQADPTWRFASRPWEQYGYDHGTEYNWREEALKNGSQQDYNLGFSGGTDKILYSASLNHFREDGLIKNDNYKRYGARLNLEASLTNSIKAGVNSIFNYSINEKNDFNNEQTGIYMSPIISPYDSTGQLIPRPKTPDEDFWNPLIYENPDYHFKEKRITRTFNTAYIDIEFLKDIHFKSSVNANIEVSKDGEFFGVFPGIDGLSSANAIIKQKEKYTIQNIFSGTKSFSVHELSFTLGNEIYFEREEIDSIAGRDLALNNSQFYGIGSASQDLIINTELKDKSRVAFLGRLNYNLMDKYLFSASFRYDGASQLAEGNKWNLFPAVSVGWNLHEENFMNFAQFLTQFKIRAGYGITGNESVDAYQTLGLLTENPLYYEFGLSESPALGYRADNAPNPNLGWEKTKSWNFGIDLGLFNDRIQGILDIYGSTTDDLLQELAIAPHSGVLVQTANVGSLENKGIEVTLKTNNISNSNFSWVTEFTYYKNNEKIVELSSGRTTDELNGWFVGYPVNVFFSRKKTGIWQIDDTEGMNNYELYGAKPGDTRYLDVNGDTAITDADRVVVGSRRPKWTGGFTSRMTYKNIDLTIFVFARIGQTIQDNVRLWGTAANARETPMAVDYWTPENPTNDMPSPTYIANRSGSTETPPLSYVDGSFVKIRDITLGYNLPAKTTARFGISKIRIYVTVQNAFAFGKYFTDGSDSFLKGNRNDPELEGDMKVPAPKMFGGGLNITF